MLSEKAKAEIRALQARYPVARSALGPALYVAQREVGWLPPDVMAEVGELFGLDATEVGEFASFYHMLNTHREPGQYHIEICTNVPCMLRGSGKLADALTERLGIGFGETTSDGKFTLGQVECLGSCATAPMFSCTEKFTGKIRYFEQLDTPEKIDEALALIAVGPGVRDVRAVAPGALSPRRQAGNQLPVEPCGQARFAQDRHLHRRRRLRDRESCARRQQDAGPGDRRDEGRQRARSRRRGLPGRPEVELPARGQVSALPGGQRRRVGAGHLQRSHDPGVRPSPVGRGHHPGLLRHRSRARLRLRARRVLLRGAAAGRCGQRSQSQRLPGAEHLRQRQEPGCCRASRRRRYECGEETAHYGEGARLVYVRGEYYFAAQRLEDAVNEAKAKGFLGQNIFGSGKNLDVVVHRGAGAYECGEETAQLTSLEGYRGHPRLKPPFPAIEGLYAKPTIVNNVETISNVPHVLRHGADWYKQWGTRAEHRLPHLLPQRSGEEPRFVRVAARHHSARADLRLRRRADRGCGRTEGGDARRPLDAASRCQPARCADGLREPGESRIEPRLRRR